MPIDPNSPNFIVSEDNLAMLKRKESENRGAVGGGLFSSWTTRIEDLDPALVPEDKRKLLLQSQVAHPAPQEEITTSIGAESWKANQIVKNPTSKRVVVPLQAMRILKKLIGNFFELELVLTADQAKIFLEALQSMPTPKKVLDAKAIFNLMEVLSK